MRRLSAFANFQDKHFDRYILENRHAHARTHRILSHLHNSQCPRFLSEPVGWCKTGLLGSSKSSTAEGKGKAAEREGSGDGRGSPDYCGTEMRNAESFLTSQVPAWTTRDGAGIWVLDLSSLALHVDVTDRSLFRWLWRFPLSSSPRHCYLQTSR